NGIAMPAATSVSDLSKVLGTPRAPIVVDVRRDEAFKTAKHLIAGAIWRSPQRVQHWREGLSSNRPLVVYCAHGQEVSQGIAEALDAAGASASYLTGGFGAWETQNLPLRRKRAEEGEGPSRWGDAGAAKDRPHRLPVADPAFHRPDRDLRLRVGGPGPGDRQRNRRHALRCRWG